MKKTVIFVGGTSYSGSTFFDMTLGNDPAGFSCGEVYALFHPFRAHHVAPDCGCADEQCDVWPQVLAAGEDRLYQTIFDRNPAVDFIVDSSKDPFWIADQAERLDRAGIEVKHILIWKTPVELAASFKKRGEFDAWERSWVNYFRLYLTLIRDWRAVPYADYTKDPTVLADVCAYLGIPYFEGKKAYWEKTHHLLFGNDSARVHLAGDGEYTTQTRREPFQEPQLQTIYYRAVEDVDLQHAVARTVQDSPYIEGILALLQARDVRNLDKAGDETAVNLRMNFTDVQLRRLKQAFNFGMGRLRFAR